MRRDGELESVMPPDHDQTTKRSYHGKQIPPKGLLETHYLIAGTTDTSDALRGATVVIY